MVGGFLVFQHQKNPPKFGSLPIAAHISNVGQPKQQNSTKSTIKFFRLLCFKIWGFQGLVNVPFWEYWTSPKKVAMALTIYHSWLGDVKNGDI